MPTGFRPTFTHMLRRAWLAGAAGGFAGFLIGGIGGRLAMFVLRLTSDARARGVESDDGFTIGEFSLQTGFLLLVTAAAGSFAAVVYMTVRPALPARWRRAMWTMLCGAVGGAAIIHSDGVDFTLLEPTSLAIAMFIAIPAGGGWLMAYFIDCWQPWWARDRRKTAIASVAVVPIFLAGVGIVPGTVIVAVAIIAILSQVGTLRTVARHVAIRAAVCLGLAALTAFELVDLTGDVRTLM
ncbi:MAG TPA: hypothetical protein VM282_18165 [Acidimicrobiales bacterium]|nr:hypothetical protein [Acidimicrobiales bacterium]